MHERGQLDLGLAGRQASCGDADQGNTAGVRTGKESKVGLRMAENMQGNINADSCRAALQ